jgi:hypothetical protein
MSKQVGHIVINISERLKLHFTHEMSLNKKDFYIGIDEQNPRGVFFYIYL